MSSTLQGPHHHHLKHTHTSQVGDLLALLEAKCSKTMEVTSVTSLQLERGLSGTWGTKA